MDTPFGDILISEGMTLKMIRNKKFLYEIIVEEKLKIDDEADALTQLIHFEKINNKYPNEPFIRYAIASNYKDLNEEEKYQAAVIENFDFFNREDPNIDAAYLQLLIDQKKEELASSLVGDELNLHQLYPKLKMFDKDTIEYFYAVLTDVFAYRKDFETAMKCAEIVSSINPKEGHAIETMLEYKSDPRKMRRAALKGLLIMLTILVVIIWGIVKFFQWIF